jgi:hypothetical protein
MAVFVRKNNAAIKYFAKILITSLSKIPTRICFAESFGENIIKIITSVPGHYWMLQF